MKYFLLVAGDQYYPESGAGDWIECFATHDEAVSKVTTREGNDSNRTKYFIGERYYDWYEIINLKDWIENGIGERWSY